MFSEINADKFSFCSCRLFLKWKFRFPPANRTRQTVRLKRHLRLTSGCFVTSSVKQPGRLLQLSLWPQKLLKTVRLRASEWAGMIQTSGRSFRLHSCILPSNWESDCCQKNTPKRQRCYSSPWHSLLISRSCWSSVLITWLTLPIVANSFSRRRVRNSESRGVIRTESLLLTSLLWSQLYISEHHISALCVY